MEEEIMKYFTFTHLPAHLQEVSEPFAVLAQALCKLPANEQRGIALQKLLEAKDAAVRAKLDR